MLNNNFNKQPEQELARSILETSRTVTSTIDDRRNEAFEALLQFSTIELNQFEDLSALTPSPSRAIDPVNVVDDFLKHKLILSEDFFTATCKEKDGSIRQCKRRKRGKCVHCGRCTTTYCATCLTPNSKHLKYWCCSNETNGCPQKHLDYSRYN